jgi:hypothetical protein
VTNLAVPVPIRGVRELERDEHVTVWAKPPGTIRYDLVDQRPTNE